jgi:hypothetical protein
MVMGGTMQTQITMRVLRMFIQVMGMQQACGLTDQQQQAKKKAITLQFSQ